MSTINHHIRILAQIVQFAILFPGLLQVAVSEPGESGVAIGPEISNSNPLSRLLLRIPRRASPQDTGDGWIFPVEVGVNCIPLFGECTALLTDNCCYGVCRDTEEYGRKCSYSERPSFGKSGIGSENKPGCKNNNG